MSRTDISWIEFWRGESKIPALTFELIKNGRTYVAAIANVFTYFRESSDEDLGEEEGKTVREE